MAVAVLVFLVTVALLAPALGVDTRDGRDWRIGDRGRLSSRR